MAIITDTSVIIAIILNEKSKNNIIEATIDEDLIAPFSLHWEIGNAFSAMLKRKRLTLKETINALKVYNEIPIRFIDIDLESAIRLSLKHNLYAYDCYFLEGCIKNKIPLLTLDQKLIEAAQEEGIKIIEA
jgi:predicted nucleic acid-binding protein